MSEMSTLGFEDDMSFKPELCRDILDIPTEVIHKRLEAALRAQKDAKPAPSNHVPRRAKQVGPTFHCEVCEENPIYKAPTNVEVKFTQFSKLTRGDMEDALFQRDSTIYQAHSNLMKIVTEEQVLFENFLKSLRPKFTQVKTKLAPSWFEYVRESYKQSISQVYGTNRYSYRLSTTHVLNVSITAPTAPSIERYGQIIAYGTIHKLKLPKLGQQIKCRIETLKSNRKQHSKRSECPTVDAGSEHSSHRKESSESLTICVDRSAKDLGITVDNSESQSTVLQTVEPSNDSNALEDTPSRELNAADVSENKLTETSDIRIEDKDPIKEPMVVEEDIVASNCEVEAMPVSSSTGLYKHVKVAISQDLDVFITNVPINTLGTNHRSDLSHENVIDFFLSLKVADCIADIESLCNVFSSFPPDFSKAFLFKIDVCVQDDKSKYFKVSAPLPSPTATPESIKQEMLTKFIFKTSSMKSIGHEDDANISFLEYLNDCGAQLIDKQVSSDDIQTQIKEHIEPMKFTSFMPWVNLNSKELESKLYSLFSVVDTNIIVHSEQPYVVNFQNSLEKAVVYVKPQYCYEYGLENITNEEYSHLYLKSLLLDCVGAVVVHVDMRENYYNIVQIDNIPIETLSTCFSKAEAIGRLTSFFEVLHTLKEGHYVYNHDINQPHSVIYEEFDNQHIQADFHLSSEQVIKLIGNTTSPVQLSKTQLTAWQRHNVRLPLCYHPRRPGTYFCHEYLSRESCSNNRTCAFAHLTKEQLKNEMGTDAYNKFIEDFERPKNEKNRKNEPKKRTNPNFGKILDKRRCNRSNRGNRGNKKRK